MGKHPGARAEPQLDAPCANRPPWRSKYLVPVTTRRDDFDRQNQDRCSSGNLSHAFDSGARWIALGERAAVKSVAAASWAGRSSHRDRGWSDDVAVGATDGRLCGDRLLGHSLKEPSGLSRSGHTFRRCTRPVGVFRQEIRPRRLLLQRDRLGRSRTARVPPSTPCPVGVVYFAGSVSAPSKPVPSGLRDAPGRPTGLLRLLLHRLGE